MECATTTVEPGYETEELALAAAIAYLQSYVEPQPIETEVEYTWLQYVADNENELRGVIHNWCGGRYELCDEIFSDVLWKVENACRTFDETKGDFRRHVNTTIGFYTRKWIAAHAKRQRRFMSLSPADNDSEAAVTERVEDAAPDFTIATLNRESVSTILQQLPEYERQLLHLKFALDWTYVDIGRALGCAESTIRKHVDSALIKAREIHIVNTTLNALLAK